MLIGKGSADRYLSTDEVRSVIAEAATAAAIDGKRVLIIIPDGTRTMPMPTMFSLFHELVRPRVKALDYLVALGTHPPMSDAHLSRLVGRPVVNGRTGDSRVMNHLWADATTFVQLGIIPARDIAEITGGLMEQDVVVRLNRAILDYDHIIICGPVFPHEVVGFSGGNKYFFPGIAGPEIINFTHWLGAVITSYKVIGVGYTPVRAVIDRAAQLIPRPASCFALVVADQRIAGLCYGSAPEAWTAASRLSAQKHITWVEKPFQRVLSVVAEMYDDLWTAAKGMYKTEPVVADGGEVIIYNPQLSEVSHVHGKLIDEIGYHCRDYFTRQWSRFAHYPGGVLAHSTHVKGLGQYEPATGIETPRIQVTLATGIPEERCRRINLGYLDPATIKLDEWRDREGEGILFAPHAGEMLYRLKGHRQGAFHNSVGGESLTSMGGA